MSVAIATIPKRYNASLLLDRNLEAGRRDKAAILWGDETLTYGELHARACGAGAELRDLGVERGERVLLVMDDNPGFPAAFLGAMRIGAVPVPVNPLYGADDYPYFVGDSGARLAIVDALCAEKVRAPKLLLVDELEPSEELLPVDTLRDDVAFWLYSSGSTGRPKGVVHLHRDLLYTCETYARHVLGITDEDVTFSTTKLFHAYGLGNNLSFPYWAGATTVLLSAHAVQRDARGRARRRLLVREVVHLRRRAASRRRLVPVAGEARPRDPRRRRLDGDAPHLLLEHPRGRHAGLQRPAGAGLRREARRRRRRRRRRAGIRRPLRPRREHAP